jgi:hypothetical protein
MAYTKLAFLRGRNIEISCPYDWLLFIEVTNVSLKVVVPLVLRVQSLAQREAKRPTFFRESLTFNFSPALTT